MRSAVWTRASFVAVTSEETGEPLTDHDAARFNQCHASGHCSTKGKGCGNDRTTKTRRAGELLETQMS